MRPHTESRAWSTPTIGQQMGRNLYCGLKSSLLPAETLQLDSGGALFLMCVSMCAHRLFSLHGGHETESSLGASLTFVACSKQDRFAVLGECNLMPPLRTVSQSLILPALPWKGHKSIGQGENGTFCTCSWGQEHAFDQYVVILMGGWMDGWVCGGMDIPENI